MLFNSYIFIFLFLPIALFGYFGLNRIKKYTMAKVFIVIMSLWFYSYTNHWYLILILLSLIGNYTVSFFISIFEKKQIRGEKDKKSEILDKEYIIKKKISNISYKIIGATGIIWNLALLFYYKYYDFFISQINAVLKVDWALKNIVLPLGISFFTFQQIAFIVDRIKGKVKHYSIVDYMLFVAYFPQLIAGPIVNHRDMLPQFNDITKKSINWENLARGITLFILGLAKKLLIADNISLIVNYCFNNIEALDSFSAAIGMFAYSFQIFYDFSGYSDMALGLGQMMNIKIPVNFESPYKAKSVKEFWQRWHITLNKFLTEYVYIPLGGNRKGAIPTFVNVMIIFFLSGLWHGANWTFVIWGLCHGLCVAVQNLCCNKEETKNRILSFCKWFLTFIFVCLAWVLFYSKSISLAWEYYKKIFSFTWNGSVVSLAWATDSSILHIPISLIKCINGDWVDAVYIVYTALLLGIAGFFCTRKSAYRWSRETKFESGRYYIGLSFIFVLSILSLSDTSAFLYFNF